MRALGLRVEGLGLRVLGLGLGVSGFRVFRAIFDSWFGAEGLGSGS